jgi:hypothetical protein
MLVEVGNVEAIFRYPVKSMAGERLDAGTLGWHRLDGDRRLAFRLMDNRSPGFPPVCPKPKRRSPIAGQFSDASPQVVRRSDLDGFLHRLACENLAPSGA